MPRLFAFLLPLLLLSKTLHAQAPIAQSQDPIQAVIPSLKEMIDVFSVL